MTDGDPLLGDYTNRVYLLGMFCLEFANTEYFLQETVRRLANLDAKMFMTLFSGLRCEGAMQHVRRLLEAANAPESQIDAYDNIFQHVHIVLEARNLILHHGVTFIHGVGVAPLAAVATNRRIALSESRERTIPFTAEMLQQLIHDTNKANVHLSRELVLAFPPDYVLYGADVDALQQPWLCTPLQVQKQKPPQRSGKGHKRARVPKDQR
jgi:hypothetical protein